MTDLQSKIEELSTFGDWLLTEKVEFPKRYGYDPNTFRTCNFKHLVGNRIAAIYGTRGVLEEPEIPEEKKEMFYQRSLKGIEAMRLYFRLLQEFPEFRDGEFAGQFFEDLSTDGEGHLTYAYESERRLRQKS